MNDWLGKLGFRSSEDVERAKAEVVAELQRELVASGSFHASVAVAPVAVLEPPPVREPVPIPEATIDPVPTMAHELREQYRTLAAELGVTQKGLEADAARELFKVRGTRLYDSDKVAAYLTDQYGAEKVVPREQWMLYGTDRLATWGWRPLRAADHTGGGWRASGNGTIGVGLTPYSKPVPLPVLLTVREVSAQFPAAGFFVSDEIHAAEQQQVLDPFLLVVIEGERFIIERWDEPAYRE